MGTNKKIIVTIYWKNYVTPSSEFNADPQCGGYNISKDGKFYSIRTIDGFVSIPVENVQCVEQKNIFV